ncbi:BnaA03g55040D [Brassica napus]|uniref:BnaA03g55040D protein n=1 Tax=Brassica napus TaxID=3708 RepID=A0A078IXW7_BRANA|nr:BnaA03g55040D [Brassica napus]
MSRWCSKATCATFSFLEEDLHLLGGSAYNIDKEKHILRYSYKPIRHSFLLRLFVGFRYKKKMKQEEQEREDLYHTDDDEDEESQAHSSVPSTPLSRNDSNTDAVPWPRSYRQSMDLLTGVTPPISTNLVSSFRKRRQSSAFGSFASSSSKQSLLIDKDETQNSIVTSIKSFTDSHLKLSVPDDLSIPQENRKCTISQSVINGVNVLCGGALLTMPYALKEGGWLGLLILFSFGIITLYTGILLKRCLENSPGIHTYPDIGQAAFGTTGRILLSIFLYMDLYATCVEYIIMMSDNMSGMFPNTSLYIAGISLNSNQVFAVTTTLIVLPTVWLRDLSLLSYISAGGVFSSILLALCLFWVGSVGGVGFQLQGQVLDLTNLPVAIGIYGFGFGGHAVLPNIYSSMKEPSKFPLVLLMSFGFCTLFYIAISVCGYTMFGEAIQSQFTLNMPQYFTSSKIAVWTAVITPMTKYPLTLTPVLLSLEELLPSSSRKMRSKGVSMIIRTILVLSTLVVALTVPFFATVAALIGSFVAMLIAVIFPCLCYLKIMKGRLTNFHMAICVLIIIVGVVSGVCGTYSAIVRLIGEMT